MRPRLWDLAPLDDRFDPLAETRRPSGAAVAAVAAAAAAAARGGGGAGAGGGYVSTDSLKKCRPALASPTPSSRKNAKEMQPAILSELLVYNSFS